MLSQAGVPTPEVDAVVLLAHAWGIDSNTLDRHRLFDETVPVQAAGEFARLCDLRRVRVPLQHLTGVAYFRRLELQVGPGVFVPRPETELLVTEVLDELRNRGRPESRDGSRSCIGPAGAVDDEVPLVIDLCSGSGAISLSLATEHPRLHVIGVEREPEAIAWSRKNLEAVHLGDSEVDLIEADATVFARSRRDLQGRADVVVTNPPYVPDAAIPCDPEVRDHDPASALYGGSSGLEIPELLICEAECLLRPGGLFIMEHSEEQGAGVRELIGSTASLRQAATFADYTGRDRYTVARRNPETRR